MELDEIQRCDLITGVHDYVLTLRLPGMTDYNRYLRDVPRRTSRCLRHRNQPWSSAR